MPSVSCPVLGCNYATPETDAVIVAALLTTHATLYNTPAAGGTPAKVEGVRRLTIISASTSED